MYKNIYNKEMYVNFNAIHFKQIFMELLFRTTVNAKKMQLVKNFFTVSLFRMYPYIIFVERKTPSIKNKLKA